MVFVVCMVILTMCDFESEIVLFVLLNEMKINTSVKVMN